MEKLWGGRFQGKSEAWIDDFGASISFDQKMAKEDLTGSLAHVTMLGKCGIISDAEAAEITAGLKIMQEKLALGELEFSTANEDIHLNIETLLYTEIGPIAGKLHTARSRNDQVATDMHLYLKQAVADIIHSLKHLREVLVQKAGSHVETIMQAIHTCNTPSLYLLLIICLLILVCLREI